MRVSKWGNSLAVRIPAEIVEELGLKEGDEVTFSRKEPNKIVIEAPMSAKDRLAWLEANGSLLPDDYRFSRSDAYEGTGRY
jgi:antitoxin MazE